MITSIFTILGAAALLYGICVLSINSGTYSYVLWFGIAAFFFLCAVCAHRHLLQMLPKGVRWMLIALFAAGLIFFCIVEGMICSGFVMKSTPELDYVIVLGAQVKSEGPSRVLQYRLDAAYDYLAKNPNTICIVSGGQGLNEPMTEAEGMYNYLTERGIERKRILLEDQSTDTTENIRNSSTFFDPAEDAVGIVTNNFHMYRSIYLARKQGIKNVYGISAGASLFYLPNNMLREFFGVVRDVIL